MGIRREIHSGSLLVNSGHGFAGYSRLEPHPSVHPPLTTTSRDRNMALSFLMRSATIFTLTWLIAFSTAALHLPLTRRGGRFVGSSSANLTFLANLLADVEERYAQTQRTSSKNHLERTWTPRSGAVDDEHLVGRAGHEGAW